MARGAISILMRELKALVAAGVPLPKRALIDDGKTKIVLTFGAESESLEVQNEPSEPTVLDKWRASRGTR